MKWHCFMFCFLLIAAQGSAQLLKPYKTSSGSLDKWGFKNPAGQVSIPARFEEVQDFSEGLAAVKVNGLWGFINMTGRLVVNPKYFHVLNFSEGKAPVFNGRFGYINKTGVLVIPMKFGVAQNFENGVARVFNGGEWTYIDHQGKPAPAPLTPLTRPKLPLTGQTLSSPGFHLMYALDRKNGQLRNNPAVDAISRNGIMENLVKSLNNLLRIPYRVNIIFEKINTPNAYYSAAEKKIYFGVEMIELLYSNLSAIYEGQKLIDATTDAVVFILFHEIGHALIDILDIPIGGREEEAADNFATYLFSNGTQRLEQIALNGAQVFYNWSRSGTHIPLSRLLDEHLLDGQRALSILCLLYGKDPNRYGYLVSTGVLPADERRQFMCRNEYAKLANSWHKLLKEHLK